MQMKVTIAEIKISATNLKFTYSVVKASGRMWIMASPTIAPQPNAYSKLAMVLKLA